MSATGRIQGITFDVGGTLIEPWPSVGHVYAEVAARHGWKDISPALLDERFRAAWRSIGEMDYSPAGWERLVQETFRGLLREPDRVPFFPQLYERFAEAEVWRIFDDVRPVLRELKSRGIRLGVISNWDERLRVLLRRLRLDDCFESVVVSCEEGCTKPSPAIFERAAARLGLPPGVILHVGDSEEMDVRGATGAGFRAVRIVRGGSAARDHELNSLAGLAARL